MPCVLLLWQHGEVETSDPLASPHRLKSIKGFIENYRADTAHGKMKDVGAVKRKRWVGGLSMPGKFGYLIDRGGGGGGCFLPEFA